MLGSGNPLCPCLRMPQASHKSACLFSLALLASLARRFQSFPPLPSKMQVYKLANFLTGISVFVGLGSQAISYSLISSQNMKISSVSYKELGQGISSYRNNEATIVLHKGSNCCKTYYRKCLSKICNEICPVLAYYLSLADLRVRHSREEYCCLQGEAAAGERELFGQGHRAYNNWDSNRKKNFESRPGTYPSLLYTWSGQ